MTQYIGQQSISPQSPLKGRKTLVQPHFIVALILASRSLNCTRHENDPASVNHYDLYLTPIENADDDSTAPSSRRVRPRAANRLRDCSSEFFEKKTTKKNFSFGRKKNWFASPKTDLTTITFSQVGQPNPKKDDIDFFEAGLRARGLKSHVAPKYCTLEKSEEFFRYLGYQVSRKRDDTNVMTDRQ